MDKDKRGEVRRVGWFQWEALMPVGRALSGSWLVEKRTTRWGANRALKELRRKVAVKPDRSTKQGKKES